MLVNDRHGSQVSREASGLLVTITDRLENLLCGVESQRFDDAESRRDARKLLAATERLGEIVGAVTALRLPGSP